MYSTLFTKIGTTLGNVPNVKESFFVPKNNPTKFPAVFYKPSGMVNTFETQNENMKIYRFMLVVMVGVEGTTLENAVGTVLPNTVDAIIDQFDEEWNGGTIDGHRVTVVVDSADPWEVSDDQKGRTAYAPLNLEIRLLTSN